MKSDIHYRELEELLETLDRTQRRIREIVGEDVDTIMLPSGRAQLLPGAQDALQREELLQGQFAAQRAAILDALPSHIALIDQRGTIIAVNEAWRRFGRDNANPDPDHGVGSNYLEVCDRVAAEDPAQDFGDGIRAVLQGASDDFSVEYPCDSPTEARWFRLQVVPVQLGMERGAAVIHTNVTSEHDAETAKGRALWLFEVASKVARIGGWNLDLQQQRLEWSDQVFAIHDLTPGEPPTPEQAMAFMLPEWRDMARGRLLACSEHGESFDEEFEILTAKGRRIWVRSTGEALRDASGRVTHIQGAFQDVSREKDTLAALATSESRFQRMADSLPILIFTAEADGTLDYANGVYYQLVGRDPQHFALTSWLETVAVEDRERAAQSWQQAISSGSTYSIEFRVITAAGDARWHHVAASQVRGESGAVLKWYGTGVDIHDRVLAEDEALRLANQIQVTLNSISDSFVALDADWRYTYLNERAAAFFQRSIQEVLGTSIWESFPALQGTNLEAGFREVMHTRQSRRFEYRSQITKGYLDVTAYPSNDGGIAIYFRDVSEMVEARQRLEHEEARFRAVTQAATDVVWDWDIQRQRIWWSEGLLAVFGHPDGGQETPARLWTERVHPDDRERVLASIMAVREQRKSLWEESYRYRHADGQYRDVDDRGVAIFDAEGAVLRMVGGMTDVTDVRRAEATLARQAALLDQARDAIVLCDSADRIRFWNRSAERIYGWSAGEVMGQPLDALLYEHRDAYSRVVDDVRSHGEWRGRMQQQRADGTVITVEGHWVRVDADAAPGGEADVGAVMAINTDITDQLALEEQLSQAQRLESVGQLTGGIAHDFNNLLTIVLGNSDLLVESLAHDDDMREMAGMIQTAAERAAELTQRLLAFARKQPLDPRSVDVNALVLGMDRMLRRTLGEQVEIELVRGAGLWQALVDEGQLENAVLNLCINARDAMPSGGRLTLETSNAHLDETYASQHSEVQPGQYVRVSISDTGTGMSPETMKRAFDPFFTTKEVGRGSGLGLSMVYGFIKQSQGHVRIYSEIGEGTTVHLYLPRVIGAGERGVRGAAHVPAAPLGQGEKILLVEDDELVRNHLTAQLRALGYQVVAARNGPEGLQVLRQFADLDLLFTDVVMPGGMSGRDLADAARLLRPDLPVLFTSGYTENAIVHHGRLDAGVQLLSKPYRQQDLARKVRRVLDMGRGDGEG
ncbi:MAG: PAS domain S-box protein [Gammaproteobacteria bacterium]|nr:PAS domain S-box protein [Gammaproteobacteria bacterium]